MHFWKTSGYTYRSFSELPIEKITILINALSRQDLIEWLSWNDSNGIYNDKQSLKELGRIMSKEEGIEVMFRQIEEGQGISA